MKDTFHKISRIIKKKPFFWILVPLFFILKNANIYFTAIPGMQITGLLAAYLAGSCILYFILFRVFKKNSFAAALYCFILLAVYFFQDNFDHFIQAQKWLYPFNRYRWSLTALFLLLGITFFYIRRLRSAPGRTTGFLNLLLIFFCLSEAIPLLYKSVIPQPSLLTIAKEAAPLTSSPLPPLTPTAIHQSPASHPNIYFLLLDEYQGNAGLQKVFNDDNSLLKTALASKGFFSPRMARSNYNFTFFSMPSILNMNYLEGEIQGKSRTEDLLLFSSGIGLIQNSRLIRFLKTINYTIVNLSPFSLDSSEERVSRFNTILAEKDLITRQTFFNSIKDKFGWMITDKKILRFLNPLDYNTQYYNEYIRQGLHTASAAAHAPRDPGSTQTPAPPQAQPQPPKFVYAHFFIPHAPFLKDSSGNEVDFKQLIQKGREGDRQYMDEHYLAYLKYGNEMLIRTIDTLIRNDPGAIIMIMSDHGYRALSPEDRDLQYNIQFYTRTPEQNYSGWPDTVDAVNAFRLLLNKEFGQQFGYLPYRKKEFIIPGNQIQ